MNTLQKELNELENKLFDLGFEPIQIGGHRFWCNSNRDIYIYTCFSIIDYVEYWNSNLNRYVEIHNIGTIEGLLYLLPRLNNELEKNI